MPKLVIDNLAVEVPPGTPVIAAAEQLGIMIPRFCYHPGLGSFGACRMCAARFLEGPVKGVEMSCMVEAKDGMVVSTTHPDAVEFRRYVIEWLMLHHPHDCPVCDEGGHCLLQDETVSGGHGRRRYLGPKRTYRDQYLGAFVQHEMNRCIQCWRCRNFYQGFAGYRDYGALQIANRTYFGRFADGPLESPFSGNIIDLCPTGVLTDKPSRYKARRWHLERGPTLCLHCSLGCNVTGGAYLREVLRLEGRFNPAVNGYFLCDRGRYGFPYTNLLARPRQARVDGREAAWEEGVKTAASRLAAINRQYGPGAIACWGGLRSSLESQAALWQLCRRQGWPEPQFFATPDLARKVRTAVARLDGRIAVSLREIEAADLILVVGADPVNEAPMLALALRQAWRGGAEVFVMDPRPGSLPFPFFEHLALPPGHLDPALGVALRGALDAAAVEALEEPARNFFDSLPGTFAPDAATGERLAGIGAKLRASRRPAIICGTAIVRESTPGLAADGALLLMQVGKEAGLFYLLPGANAFGAALIAALGQSAEASGRTGSGVQILEGIEAGEVKALVLAECDPFRDFPDASRLTQILDKLELLLVLDYLPSSVVDRAHIVLPTVTIFERTSSTFINQEGRAQRAAPVHFGGTPVNLISPERHPPRTYLHDVPGSEPQSPAAICADLAQELSGGAPSLQDLGEWLRGQNPILARLNELTGHPEGLRLIPEIQSRADFSSVIIKEEEPSPEQWELLVTDLTFGTEELTAYSPLIHKVEEPPVLIMNSGDAGRLGLAAGDRVTLKLPRGHLTLPLQCRENMAPGVLLLPRHRLLAWNKIPGFPCWVPAGNLGREQGQRP